MIFKDCMENGFYTKAMNTAIDDLVRCSTSPEFSRDGYVAISCILMNCIANELHDLNANLKEIKEAMNEQT